MSVPGWRSAWYRAITNAGEMNGFLKTSQRLLEHPLVVEQHAIRPEPDFVPKLDTAAIARYSEAIETCPSL